MLKPIFIFLFLLPFTSTAQFIISGKVLNHDDKKPVTNASVFLNNAVVGAKTSDSGAFVLTNVRPGQYDLVVSIIGYETFHQTIMVNADIRLPNIEILPKTILLSEVKIKPHDDWARNYEIFKRLFLGTSDNARECKILNPDLLDLDYDPKTRTLSAKSDDFLEIENKALGYKIKYLLTEFKDDHTTGVLYYEGSAFFEELKGTPSQERRWKKRRLKAYENSSVHFFRSLIAEDMENNGFKVLRLIRKPNPKYKGGFDNKYQETLVSTPLTVNDIAKRTDVKGMFALSFNDCLYVMYNKKNVNKSNVKIVELNAANRLGDDTTTIIIFDEPYAVFDLNGIVINPRSIIFDGAWGQNKMAELLPVDYVATEN